MKNRVFIFRGLPQGADSRPERFANIFSNMQPRLIYWGSQTDVKGTSAIIFKLPRPVGRPILMAAFYFIYSIFVFWFTLLSVQKDDICLFIDLESAILGVWAARLKGAKSIFDIADPFFLVKPCPAPGLVAKVEEWIASKANLVLLPHPCRRKVYPQELSASNVMVVENVPDFSSTPKSMAQDLPMKTIPNAKITLGYFGGYLPVHRGIEDLVHMVRNDERFELKLGGFNIAGGNLPDGLMPCNRIKNIGTYSHEELPGICEDVDIYVGLYYSSNRLHMYATPNKYYEHLALGIPFLTSKRTPFSDAVLELNTGWVVDDGIEALAVWANELRCEEIQSKAINCKKAWSALYENYYIKIRTAITGELGII